jgi:hypothetical protein
MAGTVSIEDQLGNSSGRRQFLRTCGVTALAAGATPLISSCGIFSSSKPSVFDVLARNWIGELAHGIGAGAVGKIVEGGLQYAWAAWGPEVEAVGQGILEYGVIAAASSNQYPAARSPVITTSATLASGYRYIPGGIGYAHPVPPVVLFRASRVRQGDPRSDMLIAFVDGGKKHIVFKPWAWQTLALFVNYLTANQNPANLDIARAVCVLTLIPAGTKPQTGTIPGGLVDFYNYKSRNGSVKIALVQESNGAPTGVITATAIPGGDGLPLVKHFTLPVQAAGTT